MLCSASAADAKVKHALAGEVRFENLQDCRLRRLKRVLAGVGFGQDLRFVYCSIVRRHLLLRGYVFPFQWCTRGQVLTRDQAQNLIKIPRVQPVTGTNRTNIFTSKQFAFLNIANHEERAAEYATRSL